MYYFPKVAITDYHRVGALKKCTLSQFSNQKSKVKVSSKQHFGRSEEESFLAFSSIWYLWACLIWNWSIHITLISASGVTFPTLLNGFLCVSLIRMCVIIFKTHLSYPGYITLSIFLIFTGFWAKEKDISFIFLGISFGRLLSNPQNWCLFNILRTCQTAFQNDCILLISQE